MTNRKATIFGHRLWQIVKVAQARVAMPDAAEMCVASVVIGEARRERYARTILRTVSMLNANLSDKASAVM